MKFYRNSRWKLTADVSSEELDVFDAFKKNMFEVLHEHIEFTFLMIENHLSKHILLDAQCDELVNMKNYIINSNSFNSYYSNVIKFIYPSFEFASDNLFLRFAHYTSLSESDEVATLKLKEYIELQCIDYLLVQYDVGVLSEQKIVLKLPKEHFNKEYLYLFKPFGYELFNYLRKNITPPRGVTTKYNAIYHFLLDNGYIKNNKKEYLKLVSIQCKSDLGESKKGEPILYKKVEFKDNIKRFLNENELQLKEILKEFRAERKL
ncbi:hypothetical protein [Tenacibaculum aquimarinum]|uniref:hypothetical protein n=1 Tax=Tenacibaculum aquimarinum TaxID=2910675 RepID=UPI001F0AC3A3|nr:hypothetical protein [Tenacibaculum aquimarinum]MCH3885928.1 hypothetical protein [Tenacibaculum aquimarinum]